jgi:lipoprotein-anchoring transpeptidase ErfK/SrfK
MKKILFYILIILILTGTFSPISLYAKKGTPTEPCVYAKTDTTLSHPLNEPCGYYNLLTPLPGIKDGMVSTSGSGALGSYLNEMIKIFIGICAVLAMVMIVLGGLEYMTSELISSKENGKKKITGAIFGLIIALGSYALLYTINPDLLKTDVEIEGITIEVTLDEANFALTEQSVTQAGESFVLSGSTSPGVSEFAKSAGGLQRITIDTKTKQATFTGYLGTSVTVPINIGFNGASYPPLQPTEGDGRTPIGETRITSDRRIFGALKAALTRDRQYNLGAAFINIGVTTTDGTNRGIGFHGSANNTLGTTNGCIRMKNDDLLALAPLMVTGTRVIIK